MGIYLMFGKFGKKCGVGQLPLSGALKPLKEMDFRILHKIWIQKPSSNLLASTVG